MPNLSAPTPSTPKAAGQQDTAQKIALQKRASEQRKRLTHKRVTIAMTNVEHQQWTALAKSHGRSIPQQIQLSARAYYNNGYLPSTQLANHVLSLTIAIDRIGTLINQHVHALNRINRFLQEAKKPKLIDTIKTVITHAYGVRQSHSDLRADIVTKLIDPMAPQSK